MFSVPLLALAIVKLSTVPAPEFISNANVPAPLIAPIAWLVILFVDTVTAPEFRFNVPSTDAPLFSVNVPSTFVVPAPVIAFANVPVALNTPLFAIAPPKPSTELVNVPLLSTSPAILPVLLNVPLFVNAPPILPAFVNVPALPTAPVILPLFATVPAVFVTPPDTVEFAVTVNTASSLVNVTTSPVAFFISTVSIVNSVAFVKLKPFWLFKSIIDVFVPSVAPVIENAPAAVVPNALLNVYVFVSSVVLNVLSPMSARFTNANVSPSDSFS
jgi:hypothetical protein